MLRLSQEQLALALDSCSGIGCWDWNIPADRVHSDLRLAAFFSLDPSRASIGVPFAEFIQAVQPEDRDDVARAIRDTVLQGGEYAQDFRLIQNDRVRWIHARGRCQHNEKGHPEHFLGVVFDITDRKKSEELLAERARIAALGADVGAALVQSADLRHALRRCCEAVVKHLNAAFARIWIINANQVLELQASAGQYTHLDGPHSHIPLGHFKIGQIAQERRPHLTNDVLNDPRISDQNWARREHMVSFAGYPLFVEDRVVGVLALFARHKMLEDVMIALESVSTSIALGIERKRAEAALLASEKRYRFLAESVPQMVWTATPEGNLDYVNTQAAAYFQVSAESLLGSGWLNGVHPHEQTQVLQRWNQSLQTGTLYEVEFRLRRAIDASWRWFLARAYPMPSPDPSSNRIAGWVGTCTDIHEQKQTQEALTRANRELEEFAYVASHDLQEPLRMVNIYTQLLLRRLKTDDPVSGQYSDYIHQGVRRMETLLRDLLAFSRSVHAETVANSTADLNLALQEAEAVLENRIKEAGATITAEPLPMVRGDTNQLAHVFQNLLSNSLKYRAAAPPEIRICSRAGNNGWVISVADNGIGFQPHYAERIFGLFKRLHKDEYPGTGLGLAICQRIVERYGGKMWAEGKPDEGAVFYFSLPACEELSLNAGAGA